VQDIDLLSTYQFSDVWAETQSPNAYNALRNWGLSKALSSLKLLVFMVINNLAKTAYVRDMLQMVTATVDSRILRSFLMRPGEVAESFAEKLFPHAVETQNVKIVKYLLERGLNSDNFIIDRLWPETFKDISSLLGYYEVKRITPLGFACFKGNMELVRALISAGADVNKPTVSDRFRDNNNIVLYSPLFLSIKPSKISEFSAQEEPVNLIIHDLLQAGADVNPSACISLEKKYIHGLPLSQAAAAGELKIVKLLLDYGADVNGIDLNGRALTALLENFRLLDCERAFAIVETLIQAGADVNPYTYIDLNGKTLRHLPLSQAAIAGALKIVKLLLDYGADVNGIGPNGTALTELLSDGRLYQLDRERAYAIVEALIQAGVVLPNVKKGYLRQFQHANHPFDLIYPVIPIDYIARKGHLKLFDLIWNICPEMSQYTLLCAIESENVRIVQRVLEIARNTPTLVKSFTGSELALALKRRLFDVAELLYQIEGFPIHECCIAAAFRQSIKTKQRRIMEQLWSIILENQNSWDTGKIFCVSLAISTDQYDLVNRFIDYGGYIDKEALQEAVRIEDILLIRKFLELLDFDNRVLKNYSPDLLIPAIRDGNREIVKIFLEFFSIDELCDTPGQYLDIAIGKKDFDMFYMLLDTGINPDSEYNRTTALADAARRSDLDGVIMLLEAGANPENGKALTNAVREGSLPIIRTLLDSCIKRNKLFAKWSDSHALYTAVKKQNLEVVRLLVSYGIYGTSTHQRRTLKMATALKDVSILRELLSTGINPNSFTCTEENHYKTQTILTLLTSAITSRNLAAVELIIQQGADVNLPATGRIRRTPLQCASEVGFVDAVKLLLSLGADVNAPPARKRGATALQCAAIGGHIAIAYVLLTGGADINAPAAKINGRTALEAAAEHGRYDIVKLLLNNGVRISGDGERQYLRAIDFATKERHKFVRRLLESASGNLQTLTSSQS
jgi:ankyrin repeat protein